MSIDEAFFMIDAKEMNFQASRPGSNVDVKYNSKNPITKLIVGNFVATFNRFLDELGDEEIHNILEVGAGEGYISMLLARKYSEAQIISSDISKTEFETRKNNLAQFKNVQVMEADGCHLPFSDNAFDLVVCSEVLEHIPGPHVALKEIHRVGRKYALLSVPNEPLWHLLNMARGKYWRAFGNTPGHINAWSPWGFGKFVTQLNFDIQKRIFPIPWTMFLAKKR